jgi:hypothetical protein
MFFILNKLLDWHYMDFKESMRSDTSMSAIVNKLERRHGAINCCWRFFTHTYSASNEVISDKSQKFNLVTLAQIFGNTGQPFLESAPEYELWYSYEPEERSEGDSVLLIWPSN